MTALATAGRGFYTFARQTVSSLTRPEILCKCGREEREEEKIAQVFELHFANILMEGMSKKVSWWGGVMAR